MNRSDVRLGFRCLTFVLGQQREHDTFMIGFNQKDVLLSDELKNFHSFGTDSHFDGTPNEIPMRLQQIFIE